MILAGSFHLSILWCPTVSWSLSSHRNNERYNVQTHSYSNSLGKKIIKFLLQRQSRRSRTVYLTETPYLKSQEKFEKHQLRSGKSVDLDSINLDPDQLIDKPTLPVLDTRRANFLLGRVGMDLFFVINFHVIVGCLFFYQSSDIRQLIISDWLRIKFKSNVTTTRGS